jgi:alpha-D-xyloside xylohydrolase
LVVYAPGYPVRDRGGLMKRPSLTMELGASAADVVRVSETHFAGADRSPDPVILRIWIA